MCIYQYYFTVITLPTNALIQMICTLVIWLHLHVHVSRSVANTTLRALQLILGTIFGLLEHAVNAAGLSIHISHTQLPRDIRSAYKHQLLEPEILRTVSCPSCFSLFKGPDIPDFCEWKETPRACPCHTSLWRTVNTRKGPKRVPQKMYTTQSLSSWLSFFLSRQIIEDDLRRNFTKLQNHVPQAEMGDIQDSPAWKHLNTSSTSPYDLTFGIYIDWFNPFTNKIAGMTYFKFILYNQLIYVSYFPQENMHHVVQ